MGAQITSEEMLQSLTGFDEIAVSQQFGLEIGELFRESRATTLLRALVFVALRREGRTDLEARNDVMGMALQAVNGYFADAEDEPMPEEPVSEPGKDSTEAA